MKHFLEKSIFWTLVHAVSDFSHEGRLEKLDFFSQRTGGKMKIRLKNLTTNNFKAYELQK